MFLRRVLLSLLSSFFPLLLGVKLPPLPPYSFFSLPRKGRPPYFFSPGRGVSRIPCFPCLPPPLSSIRVFLYVRQFLARRADLPFAWRSARGGFSFDHVRLSLGEGDAIDIWRAPTYSWGRRAGATLEATRGFSAGFATGGHANLRVGGSTRGRRRCNPPRSSPGGGLLLLTFRVDLRIVQATRGDVFYIHARLFLATGAVIDISRGLTYSWGIARRTFFKTTREHLMGGAAVIGIPRGPTYCCGRSAGPL